MSRALFVALSAFLVGTAGVALAAVHDLRHAAVAYLAAFSVVLSIPLGTLGWSMICDASGAVWFVPVRRLAESISACLPALAVLFIPIIASLNILYPWAPPTAGPGSGASDVRQAYLNSQGFIMRSLFCFTCWIVLAESMRSLSLARDAIGAPDRSRLRRAIASVGLLPFVLSVSVASFDWHLSLEPSWHSSIYGLIFLAGAGAAGIAVLIIAQFILTTTQSLSPLPRADHAHALGTLLFVSIMLWAYLAFMQFLIIWMADLPDEVGWYIIRLRRGWGWLGIIVFTFQFVVPFFFLLMRRVKRALPVLSVVAACVLTAHGLDLCWQILPALEPHGSEVPWAAIAALAAIAGAVALFGLWRAHRHDVVARNDPDFLDGMAFESRL